MIQPAFIRDMAQKRTIKVQWQWENGITHEAGIEQELTVYKRLEIYKIFYFQF